MLDVIEIEKFNFLEDFLSEKEYKEYNQIIYPLNLQFLRDRLDIKLKEDPDYEVFVPAKYYQYEGKLKDGRFSSLLEFQNIFISNKGRGLSTRILRSGRIITSGPNSSGYPQIILRLSNDKSISLVLHRLVGCNFCPPPEHLKLKHFKDLEVNHIDGDKHNCKLENLEWCTNKENITHAIKTNLFQYKPAQAIKVTVSRGKYKGLTFLMRGKAQMVKFGFDQGAVSNCLNGKTTHHNNCTFEWAKKEDMGILANLTDEIIKGLKETNRLVSYTMVGVNLKTGEEIRVLGDAKLKELGFNVSGVRNVLCGISKSAGGYSWRKEAVI